mmetsp:Transcript_39941/g.114123  ORF Transcript_39941/g.114123 Transcript_39941/m.114123 type:complete len:261 (+) Transcript_39941:40-822(+)
MGFRGLVASAGLLAVVNAFHVGIDAVSVVQKALAHDARRDVVDEEEELMLSHGRSMNVDLAADAQTEDEDRLVFASNRNAELNSAVEQDDSAKGEGLEENEEAEDSQEDDSMLASLRLNFRVAEKGISTADGYRKGERAEFKTALCSSGILWAKCVITGKGQVPYSYNVRIPDNPAGQQEVGGIPLAYLRKGGTRRSSYEVGEAAEVQANRCHEGGTWVAGIVVDEGTESGTYNIEVPDGTSGESQEIPGVPIWAMRRAA